MKERYLKFRAAVDADRMLANCESLLKLELGQTVSCWHASAERALELLKENGIPNAEKITFPADGKTAYQDKITPLGWEATVGRLTVLKGAGIEPGFVAADYQRHPFHLIKGSTATEPGGRIMRLITEEQMLAGADPHDALVLIPPPAHVSKFNDAKFRRYLDMGAVGVVTDYAKNAVESPDTMCWCNAFTEGSNWHTVAGERDYINFCVTPRTGQLLRDSCANGEVLIKVESDGRRFEDTVDVVTAMVPGRRKEEFWIFAHLYEPLSNDNSAGVAAAIETARLIMAQGKQQFSLRVIFGLEHYGFAAYASTRGDDLRGQVLGGIDCDAMYLRSEWGIDFRVAGPAVPFCGNRLFRLLADEVKGLPGIPAITFRNSFPTMYEDDSFLSDSTTGVPTLWPIRTGHSFWHNSRQTMDYIEKEAYATGVALQAAVTQAILSPDAALLEKALPAALEELRAEIPRSVGDAREHLAYRYEVLANDLRNFGRALPPEAVEPALKELEAEYARCQARLAPSHRPASKWLDYAAQITPSRLTTGLPYDLAKLPIAKRKNLPGRVLYSPLSAILADMDGKRDLAAIFRRVEHELCRLMDEKELKTMLQAVFFLARAGYVSLNGFKGFGKEEIVQVLRGLGIRKGDFLLFHSSLSAFGLIDGGPGTVIAALREVLGEEGSFLLPALTNCFVFLGGPGASIKTQPFDPQNYAAIWTGSLPRYFLEHFPEAPDSGHYTHRWCGMGPLAAEACAHVKPDDPPVGPDSPPAFAARHKAKIVHFGNSISSTTYLHCLEDLFDLPGVESSFVKIKRGSGWEYKEVPRNLPGHRDFYRNDAEECKFFKAAVARGLEIRKKDLGPGTVKVMELEQLERIGTELVKEDPLIFLCDSPECLSCRRLERSWKKN